MQLDRIHLLNSIGFDWDAPRGPRTNPTGGAGAAGVATARFRAAAARIRNRSRSVTNAAATRVANEAKKGCKKIRRMSQVSTRILCAPILTGSDIKKIWKYEIMETNSKSFATAGSFEKPSFGIFKHLTRKKVTQSVMKTAVWSLTTIYVNLSTNK